LPLPLLGDPLTAHGAEIGQLIAPLPRPDERDDDSNDAQTHHEP
jgi:hypothetical protein